jgi:hypothetical protein
LELLNRIPLATLSITHNLSTDHSPKVDVRERVPRGQDDLQQWYATASSSTLREVLDALNQRDQFAEMKRVWFR